MSLWTWLRRLAQPPPSGGVSDAPPTAANAAATDALPEDTLWAIVPPAGVKLVRSRPSKTGEGGRGVLAWYSDGTTASAMLNSDGSVRVLFFRDGLVVPAALVDGDPRRFTW
jgi:hypothetical protein